MDTMSSKIGTGQELQDDKSPRQRFPETIVPGIASVLGFSPLLASLASAVRSYTRPRPEATPASPQAAPTMPAAAGEQPKHNMLTNSGPPDSLNAGNERAANMMIEEAWDEPPVASFSAYAMHTQPQSSITSGSGPTPQVPLACRSKDTTNQLKSPNLMPGSPSPAESQRPHLATQAQDFMLEIRAPNLARMAKRLRYVRPTVRVVPPLHNRCIQQHRRGPALMALHQSMHPRTLLQPHQQQQHSKLHSLFHNSW